MSKFLAGALLPASLLLASCASIVGDAAKTVNVSSQPSDANVAITDETGKEIFAGTTPTTVSLEKSDGSYWGGKEYTVRFSKEGFQTQTVRLETTPNGWYLAGNLVFGGLIGWFIVDPFSGKMYALSPDEVNATLPEGSQVSANELRIVLLEDVSEAMREKMTAIN
jgi:hypothetical protein